MKNSMKNIKDRHKKLIEIIQEMQETTVHDLAEKLTVSEMTIRRDCETLSNMGKLRLSFGKVSYINENDTEVLQKQISLINEKIATAAADYVQDGQTIFINSSQTAIKLLNHLNHKRVNVITNNLLVTQTKIDSQQFVMLSGGEVKSGLHSLTGDNALDAFRRVRASISVIGCSGFDIKNGLTTTNIREGEINRTIIKNCNQLVVLANYTKLNKTANFTVGTIDDIDTLVTDEFADENIVKQLRARGIEVIQVPITK
ncbi:DeoR/GlpR family DNA-binding transcription regulator [Limosilactobacillus walteri]|uniref:DeoR/GlpR transcriptional regulator n=1 Tax=Limosilactobacillus walteri TaxID=2268022 RepID=A0ABR8P724_9LACO|nr:DeoR/GlpR family DNA-binding transcription regulator [Limosilactobacillus walteri]MBD5806482.1 DeoR/GlpR transcriptional regulator [Limosilactobacillus walteri]